MDGLTMKGDAFSKYHPGVNFLYFLGAMGCAMLIQHPAYLLAGIVCSGSYYLLLTGSKGLGKVAGMIPVFLILAAVNPLLNTYGQQVLFTCFGRPYTLEALYYGMAIATVFLEMVLLLGCYSAVLTSDKFTYLFGNLLPALSLLLVMVLRLIPNFFRKARQISQARQTIGKCSGGTTRDAFAEGLTVVGALTAWALEGSLVTADSMGSRGYGTCRRTSFQRYTLGLSDRILLALQLVFLALMLRFGDFSATYTPVFTFAPLTSTSALGLLAYWAFLLIPTALHIKEAVQWHISISKI